MGQTRYAVLDTDFVSKANIIKSGNRVLADEVLEFQGYIFFCHQKMKQELGDHGSIAAQEWLETKISSGEICCYSDKQILDKMDECIPGYCFVYYRQFLKQGCDLFDSEFYFRYFQPLDALMETGKYSRDIFLSVLQSCESQIGHRKNYGEIKAFVLSQTLKLLYGSETYIFCSDDFDARQGFANGAQIPCISILSVFFKMWKLGKDFEAVEPFFQSFVEWCSNHKNPQMFVKVWKFKNGSDKRERVTITSVLTDIYSGVYGVRKNGDLQMIREIS